MTRICLTDGGSTGKCMPKPETSSALHSCTYSCQLINPGESASGIDDFFSWNIVCGMYYWQMGRWRGYLYLPLKNCMFRLICQLHSALPSVHLHCHPYHQRYLRYRFIIQWNHWCAALSGTSQVEFPAYMMCHLESPRFKFIHYFPYGLSDILLITVHTVMFRY
jgi:hypothetical protein